MKKTIGDKIKGFALFWFWAIAILGGGLLMIAFPDINVVSFLISFLGAAISFFPLYIFGYIVGLLEEIAENTKNIEQNTVDIYVSDDGAIKDIRLNTKIIADTIKQKEDTDTKKV